MCLPYILHKIFYNVNTKKKNQNYLYKLYKNKSNINNFNLKTV